MIRIECVGLSHGCKFEKKRSMAAPNRCWQVGDFGCKEGVESKAIYGVGFAEGII
jgi:hypothetical protein